MQDLGGSGFFASANDCYGYLQLNIKVVGGWSGFDLTVASATRSTLKSIGAGFGGPKTFGQQGLSHSFFTMDESHMEQEVPIDGAHFRIPGLFDQYPNSDRPVWLHLVLPVGYAWNRPANANGLPPITALNGDVHASGSDFESYARWEHDSDSSYPRNPAPGHSRAEAEAHRHLFVKYKNTWGGVSEFALNTTPPILGQGQPGGGTITNSPGNKS